MTVRPLPCWLAPTPVDWGALLSRTRRTVHGFHRIPLAVREELVQEAVARTLEHPEVVRPEAWACRVASRLCIDWLRRRREVTGVPLEQGSQRWQGQVEARLDAARVVRCLEDAPALYRDTLCRLYLHEDEVSELVAEEVAEDGDPLAHGKIRDRVYKRRSRGLAWARRQLRTCA